MIKQKCVKLLLLVVATASSLTSWAAGFGYDFEADGFRYTITSETTVEVSFNNYGSYSGTIVIPQSASDGNKNYNVTGIGSNAFSNQDNLTGVTFPDGVTVIKDGAFSGCTGLEYVVFPPTSLTTIEASAFSGCTALDDVEIPESVTTIPYECFSGCSDLQILKLPEGLTEIGISAFESCSNLKSITLPSTLTDIKDGAFWQCDAMTSIVVKATKPPVCGTQAFLSNKKNTTVTVEQIANAPAYMQAAEWKDFSHYTGVALIDGITYYVNKNNEAEEDNNKADILAVDSSVTEPNIRTKVTIDGKEYPLTYIGNAAFWDNQNITKVVIPEGVTKIMPNAFNNCKNLATVTFPSTLTTIADRAFYLCGSLTDVEFPTGITKFYSESFAYCEKFKSLVIPEGVTEIIDRAFYGCPQLESLVLPSTLTYIDNRSFLSSSALKSIVVNATTPPSCVATSFSSQCKPTVTVPRSSILSYKQHEVWKKFNYAGTVTIDHITYAVTGDEDTVVICDVDGDWLFSPTIHATVTIDGKEYALKQINSNAFQGSVYLLSLTIPEGVTTICGDAFKSCRNLISVTLPSTLTTIGDSAFEECGKLTAINLPSSVQSIGKLAFYLCGSLKAITCEALVPPTVAAEDAFEFDANAGDKGRGNCVLTVPAAAREAYANDGVWSLFMDGTDNVVVGIEGEGRVAYADDKGILFDGANICAKANSALTFAIKPAAGYELQSATYAGDDVTEQAATGEFVTPAISADADFSIVFAAKDYLAVNDLAVEAGDNVVLPIELVNPDEVSAVQVQIVLPEGVTVALDDDGKPMVEHDASRLVDQTLDATIDGQTLTITTQAGGHSYVGTAGTLLNVTLAVDANLHHGSYAISLSGAKLSMATGETANSPAAQCMLAVSNPSGITDANVQTVKAYGEKGQLTILGAEGSTADIIATDGRVAASVKCASNSERIAMGKGVYLVRINGNVTKVVVY